MDLVHVVRHKVLVEGRTQRAVARELGLARVTVRKYVDQAAPVRKLEAGPRPRPVWDAVADRVAARAPDEWTTRVRKAARHGRMFVDYLRNGPAQLTVAPYSVRARQGAPVATPVTWEELDQPTSSQDFTIGLDRKECPVAGMRRPARSPRRALGLPDEGEGGGVPRPRTG